VRGSLDIIDTISMFTLKLSRYTIDRYEGNDCLMRLVFDDVCHTRGQERLEKWINVVLF